MSRSALLCLCVAVFGCFPGGPPPAGTKPSPTPLVANPAPKAEPAKSVAPAKAEKPTPPPFTDPGERELPPPN